MVKYAPSIRLVTSWESFEGCPITAKIKVAAVRKPKKPKGQPSHKKQKAQKAKQPKIQGSPFFHDGRANCREMPYVEYLLTPHWKITRKRAVALAGGKCSNCGDLHKLQVHHLTYDHLWYEYTSDLVVLCDTCHSMIHGQYIHPA